MNEEEYKYKLTDPLTPIMGANRQPLLMQDEVGWLAQHGYATSIATFLSYALAFPTDAKKRVDKLDAVIKELKENLGGAGAKEFLDALDTPSHVDRTFGARPPQSWIERN